MQNSSNFKNVKSSLNSKTSINKSNNINNVNNTVSLKSNGFGLLKGTNQSQNKNNSSNNFESLPPELKITFEKMVSQLDLISNTMKIFDQRIQNLEGHITTLSNRHKKGFVQKQPPYMGDYQYLMENSNSYLPNSSIKNYDEFQKYTNQNNLDYYTANIYNPNSTFKNIVNINEENKKDMFKTEIDINKINENSQQIPQNQNDNMYMGQLHEEYGSNIGEKQPEGNNEQFEQ